MEAHAEEQTYHGIAASPGIAHGKVFLLSRQELAIPRYKIDSEQRSKEAERFNEALIETRKQIQEVQDKIRSSLGEQEALIFDAHLQVTEDRALIDEVIREMESAEENVEAALWDVGHRYIAFFDQIDDEYLRERASDIRDVLRRILRNLTGQKDEPISGLTEDHVFVAQDISPSDAASIDRYNLRAIVTDAGSKTSHAVIVARSMNIPAVVGLGDLSSKISHDDLLLVDGYDGLVVVNPSEPTLYKYGKLKTERDTFRKKILKESQKASLTLDGRKVMLMANIERPEESSKALESGADGVGLFRTEYLFLNAQKLPTEEEQYEAYRTAVETMPANPVVIRTLDAGGDKMLSAFDGSVYKESNPFLGYRAIRFCLDHESIFLDQLRAILRASAHGDARILYPMISGVGELRRANCLLDRAKGELRSKGVAFNESIPIGAMIEIPSAAIAADTLLGEADFFSIGTNDLIQYLIAVDRLNDRVAHLYDPTHPAFIRLLDTVVKAGRQGKIGVSVCGEVASDPVMVPLLLGFGVESLSMSPTLLPNVKYMIQNMKMSEASELAQMALDEPDGSKVLENLLEFYTQRMDKLL